MFLSTFYKLYLKYLNHLVYSLLIIQTNINHKGIIDNIMDGNKYLYNFDEETIKIKISFIKLRSIVNTKILMNMLVILKINQVKLY